MANTDTAPHPSATFVFTSADVALIVQALDTEAERLHGLGFNQPAAIARADLARRINTEARAVGV